MKTTLRSTLGAATLTLLGAAPGLADPVTIEVLHPYPSQNSFHEAVAEAFMASNPEITVKFRASPANYDEAHQGFIRNMLTNRLPDVYHSGFHLLPETVNQLKENGKGSPMTAYMAAEGAEWTAANYGDALLALGTVDGDNWGLAFSASTPIVLFNHELVKAAGGDPENFPTEWEELIALAGKIEALDGDADGMAFDVHSWPDDWLFRASIIEQGHDFMTADNSTLNWNNDFGRDALTMFRRFVVEGGMELRDWDQSRQQFTAGKIGILFSSPNAIRPFMELIGDRFTLGSQVYPVKNKETGKVPTGGNLMLITASDKARQDAAWQYIKFATSAEGQSIAVRGSGYMPTNLLAMGPDYLGSFYDENPNWRTPLDQIGRAVAWGGYPGPNGVEIWRGQRDILRDVMAGNITVDEGLAQLVAKTESLLSK